MTKLVATFFRLIRWPNIIIIGLTLFILQGQYSQWSMPSTLFGAMLIGTLCIASAGNVINDIFDLEIDHINKPHKVIVGKSISISQAWNIYFLLNAIALLIGFSANHWGLFLSFIVTIILLYQYSKQWKKMPLIGNLVVASLCAWVVVEFWWIIAVDGNKYWFIILGTYSLFAFLSTLCREIVKDIEDIDGDRQLGCQTLPIQYGITVTKNSLIALMIILLIVLCLELLFLWQQSAISATIYSLTILIPSHLFLIYHSYQAKTSKDYQKLSRHLKWYMLLGLCLLLFI